MNVVEGREVVAAHLEVEKDRRSMETVSFFMYLDNCFSEMGT